MGDPGVGYQHLHRALLAFDLLEGGVHRSGVPHVAGHDGQALDGVPGPRGDRDAVSVGGEPPRDGHPYPPVSPRHQDAASHPPFHLHVGRQSW